MRFHRDERCRKCPSYGRRKSWLVLVLACFFRFRFCLHLSTSCLPPIASAMHFKKYYHDPLSEAHAGIPLEEWTDEHHMHARSLALIRKLYGNERELGYTAASNAAQNAYATSRSDVTCVNRNSWIGGFKGQGRIPHSLTLSLTLPSL